MGCSLMAALFGQVDGTTLKRYVLVRKLHLQELLVIEELQCAICDFTREIIYLGHYDDMAEAFNICELCGKELIKTSEGYIAQIKGPHPNPVGIDA